MKIALYSGQPYDIDFFKKANGSFNFDISFYHCHLNHETANLALGCKVVCAFVNDDLGKQTLVRLKDCGVELISLRCAGFNNVDLITAKQLGIRVTRVPEYSPNAIAEHTLALILTLNRKTHKAFSRTREANFSIDGLLGFDLVNKTVGIIGWGKIGSIVGRILKSFGCKVLVNDPFVTNGSDDYNFVPFDHLLKESDIITLHCPLTPDTKHIINMDAISFMKNSVMLINTSRGALVDTKAAIQGLKSGRIGYLGLDVYEEEGEYFFEDCSGVVIHDDTLARLLTFPNVLVTSHQAFFTQEAMDNIVQTTLSNINDFKLQKTLSNEVVLGAKI